MSRPIPKYEIKVEVARILEEGVCPGEHQVGDVFLYPEERGKICAAAFHSIYPYLRILDSGGTHSHLVVEEDGSESIEMCCPDPLRPVIFKMIRKEVSE